MIMLSAALPAASAAVAALRRATAAGSKQVGLVLRAWRHRREITRLAELDEHHLKDIGLSRTDVTGALAVSLLDDPSRVLCGIAGASHGQAAQAESRGLRQPVVIRQMPKEA